MTQHELTKLDLIHDELKEIKTILRGNGEPSKGMIVRLDRLEVSAKRFRWIVGAIVSAIALAGAESFFSFLKGSK